MIEKCGDRIKKFVVQNFWFFQIDAFRFSIAQDECNKVYILAN